MREPLRLTLTVAPAGPPVGLDEVKAALRLDDDQILEDALIAGLTRSATSACEAFTGRALITQTWTLHRDAWPGALAESALHEGLSQGPSSPASPRYLEIPKPPLQSVVQVKTFDDSDMETVWSAANYFADTASLAGRLVARVGQVFPAPGRAANGVEVQFVAGYGADPTDIPESLRQGILQMIAHLFENRGEAAPETALHACGAAALWRPFRVLEL
jgi:hypothetical protein